VSRFETLETWPQQPAVVVSGWLGTHQIEASSVVASIHLKTEENMYSEEVLNWGLV